MTQEQLKNIVSNHKNWLEHRQTGIRLILNNADLRYANLNNADLRYANLNNANLNNANLNNANLRNAYLNTADLRHADLRYADLRYADLTNADLTNADLRNADLRYADLDYSCLPLWCGGQFKTDEKICKQLIAHTLRIMELSDIGSEELRNLMIEYKTGWHHESEF